MSDNAVTVWVVSCVFVFFLTIVLLWALCDGVTVVERRPHNAQPYIIEWNKGVYQRIGFPSVEEKKE